MSFNPVTVPGFASHKLHDAVRGVERSAIHVVIVAVVYYPSVSVGS